MAIDYYQTAHMASSHIGDHEGLLYLRSLCKNAANVLDVGCGEGTRLATNTKSGWGVDISSKAVDLARRQYPHLKFRKVDASSLPFEDDEFEVVYSAFTLEHTRNHIDILNEMIRVSNKHIVILCPNFGAPNRRSPVSTENPINKFFEDMLFPRSASNWRKVTPRDNYNHIDDDTTVEPELNSFIEFLESRGLKVIKWSSMWSQELPSLNPRKMFFRLFPHLGPQIFVVAQK